MEQKALNESPAGQIVQRPGAEDEIDLVELFYLLWGHAWQIILCLILGAGLALGYTKLLVTPLYQATSSIYIVSASNNSVVNLTDLQIGAQLTADYQELILSRPLLEDVIENLELTNGEGEPMSTAALSRMITITNTDDTRILKVTVTSPDPQESADIANELSTRPASTCPRSWRRRSPTWWRKLSRPPRNPAPAPQGMWSWAACWGPAWPAACWWCAT